MGPRRRSRDEISTRTPWGGQSRGQRQACAAPIGVAVVALSCVGGGSASACSAEPPAQSGTASVVLSPDERRWLSEHDGQIRIGVTVIPPQVLRDGAEYKGLSIDYIHAMEEKLGCRFELVPYATWNEVMQAARALRIDVIFAAQRTPERSAYLLFTEPYIELPNMIVVREDRPGAASLAEMSGWSVATSEGSAVHEHLRQEFPDLELRPVADELSGLAKVSLGEVDAMVVEISRASYYIEKAGILNLRIAGDAGLPCHLRFAVRGDWPVLRDVLDEGLSAVTTKERRQIARRWISVGEPSILSTRAAWLALATGLGLIILVVAVSAAVIVWNRSLRRLVRLRTAQLREELAEHEKTEQALQEKHAMLLEAQRIAHIGNWWHDLVTGEISWSDEFFRVLGRAPQIPSAELAFSLIHPADEPVLRAAVEASTGRQAERQQEFRIVRPDGETRWIHNRWVSAYDELGREVKRIGTHQDITERKRSEEALRQSEEKYRTLIQNLPLAVVVHGADTRIRTCNTAAQALLGLTEDQLLGRAATDPGWRFRREDGTPMQPEEYPVGRVLATGRSIRNLVGGVRRPGTDEDVWVMVSADPVRGEDGEIAEVVVTFADITERRQAREKLAHLASIVEFSDDAVIGKTLDGKILSWNRGAEQLYGYRAEEVIGRSIGVLVPPDQQDGLPGIMERLKAGERIHHFETIRRRKDGQSIHVALTISPIRDDAGRVVRASTIARDITERKRAEEKLRRSEHGLAEAQRIAHLGNWELDLVDNVLTWSDEVYRIFEVDPGVFGASYEAFLNAIHPDDRDWVDQSYRDSLENKLPYDVVHRVLTKDGQIKYVNEKCETYYGDDGSPLRSVGTAHDITERKRAEDEVRRLNKGLEERVANRTAELEAANKELEAFAYSVSHDLRAPLRHIDGFVRLLGDRLADVADKRTRRYMAVIAESAKRMGRLIDDLLSFSRMGRAEVAREAVELRRVVRDVIQELSPEVAGRAVHWRVAELPVVTGDRALLQAVFVNLLANALKFTRPREDAEIEIGWELDEPDEIVVFVRDNGVGFDPAYASKLFGVFQRLHRPEEFEGTGIGLASVRRIIARHGGRTWAEGQIDRGATFYFSLPRRAAEGRR